MKDIWIMGPEHFRCATVISINEKRAFNEISLISNKSQNAGKISLNLLDLKKEDKIGKFLPKQIYLKLEVTLCQSGNVWIWRLSCHLF